VEEGVEKLEVGEKCNSPRVPAPQVLEVCKVGDSGSPRQGYLSSRGPRSLRELIFSLSRVDLRK
jgi:hypothetical protein